MSRIFSGVLLAVALIMTSPGAAVGQDQPVAMVEDVVVIARRSGAPVWRVQTPTGAVVLVGSIRSVPNDAVWNPESLEQAVAGSDSIVLSQSATMSLADFFRLRRARERLPDGTTVADYLEPAHYERLQRLGARYRQDYQHRGLVAVANDLLDRRLRYARDSGRSADAVVRSTARRSRRPVRLVGDLDATHIDDAIASPAGAQIACLVAAMAAVEAGPEGLRARGFAWTRQEVAALLASPLERALDRCTWYADETLRVQGRRQWGEALDRALAESGTVMIVAPITILAEPGGLLDRAEAHGFEAVGPEWRAEAGPGAPE